MAGVRHPKAAKAASITRLMFTEADAAERVKKCSQQKMLGYKIIWSLQMPFAK